MKEAQFQTLFGKRNTTVGVFELKFCKGKSLPFSALAEHQEKALIASAGNDGLYHKISDFPVFSNNKMRFNKPKPFDCLYLIAQPAYIVVMFWIPRKKKKVYYIYIDDWIAMREKADRKSMTEKMAIEYSEIIEDYTRS